MTIREAILQAHIEMGISPQEAEFRNRITDGCIPEAVPFTQCPVRPGMEREFIDHLKKIFRYMDAHPQETQALLKTEMAKRTNSN